MVQSKYSLVLAEKAVARYQTDEKVFIRRYDMQKSFLRCDISNCRLIVMQMKLFLQITKTAIILPVILRLDLQDLGYYYEERNLLILSVQWPLKKVYLY
jgi:hypothetical protein